MRTIHLALAAGVAAIAVSATPAAAQQSSNYQWCAQYDEGGTNCGFTTLSQCNEALSGNGGFCERRMGVAPIAAAPVTAGSSQRRRTTVGAAASQ
jgi:Protein of unknown function (DUF3551)